MKSSTEIEARSKRNPRKILSTNFRKFRLLNNFESRIKPYTESAYKRRKYMSEGQTSAIRDIRYLQDEEFGDRFLEEQFDEESPLLFESQDIVKTIEKGLDENNLLKFRVYMDLQKICKTEKGLFLKYAQKMRKDANEVKKNTLTNWGKYQINEKLFPEIRRIVKREGCLQP